VDEDDQDVFLVELGTPGAVQLTQDGVNDSFAEWSPDGSRIAYASFRDGQWDLYVVAPDGSGTVRLTDDPEDDVAPRWSPDGMRLVYVSGVLEGVVPPDRVRVIDALGSDPIDVSPVRLDAFSPTWSPSGHRIAFIGQVGSANENWELFTVRADGADLTRVTRSKAMEFDPSWARRPV
jgi:TolB protein